MLERWSYRAAVLLLVALAIPLTVAAGARMLGMSTLIVKGSSMGSAVPLGSLAIGEWLPAEEIALRDVILIEQEGKTPFVHRIIDINERQGARFAMTQGDANAQPDANRLLLDGRVLRVRFSFPWVGAILDFAMRPGVLILLLVVIPALMLGKMLWRQMCEPESA